MLCVISFFFLILGCNSCVEYDLRPLHCQQPCYLGPAGTEGIGPCMMGDPVCDQNGVLIECQGQVLPEDEYCDGVDNDCNGFIDDRPMDYNWMRTCGENTGECDYGRFQCIEGELECIGESMPTEEICDGKDNDCDGFIDEYDEAEFCYDGPPETLYYGECHAGIIDCVQDEDGNWGEVCEQQQLPEEEECDGIDNDCDGFIDEDLELDDIDVVFIVDVSGSMGRYFNDVLIASQLFSQNFNTSTRFQFSLLTIPGYGDPYGTGVVTDFVDAVTFQNHIAGLTTFGGNEASLDAPYHCVHDLGLSWRPDSRKYVVLFTDELAQSFTDPLTTEADVASLLIAEDITFYAFIKMQYSSQFDDIAYGTGGNLFSLSDNATMMENDMATMFSDECF